MPVFARNPFRNQISTKRTESTDPIQQHFALPRRQTNAAHHRVTLKKRLATGHGNSFCTVET
ncbi:hypothetical protein GCT19_40325 [Paraburkholderia sp. CNPSo 3155]|nr:hypothetical protein [Paraburkholderia atlantica]NUY36110.1 hypothetical protein [Paraburkholderia atlantica]